MSQFFKTLRNLFKRFERFFNKAAGDPVEDAKTDLNDRGAKLASYQERIAKLAASILASKAELKLAEEKAETWDKVAKKAAEKEEEENLRIAVSEKIKVIEIVNTLKSDIGRNEEVLSKLKEQFQDARTKFSDDKSELVVLAARKEGAELRKEMAQVTSGLITEDTGAFDLLKEQVSATEYEAEAFEDLTNSSSDKKAQELLKNYSGKSLKIEEEMAKYKTGQ